MFEVLYIEYL